MKRLTATHVIPLIGPFLAAAGSNNIESRYVFSFSPFADNEQHIKPNYGYEVNYTLDAVEGGTVRDYKFWFHRIGYHATDLMFSIPPCAGLSMMTSGADPAHRERMNHWMYEVIKAFLASGCELLMFENAYELTQSVGWPVLQRIVKLLPAGYKVHVIKCTTAQHGLPQNRRRSFVFIYQSDRFYLPVVPNRMPARWDTFFRRPAHYDPPGTPSLHYPSERAFRYYHGTLQRNKLYRLLRRAVVAYDRNCMSLFKYIKVTGTPPARLVRGRRDRATKLYRQLQRIYKLRRGWDSSPLVYRHHCGAVTKKNCNSIIHPKYDRLLSYREIMDLMGLPDDFKLANPQRNFNHVCQNIPLPTVTDHVAAAVQILRAVQCHKLFADNLRAITHPARILVQDNHRGARYVIGRSGRRIILNDTVGGDR